MAQEDPSVLFVEASFKGSGSFSRGVILQISAAPVSFFQRLKTVRCPDLSA